MSDVETEKMIWFASQEEKGKGTFLDSKVKYKEIIENKTSIAKEKIFEYKQNIFSCDSGGCTD